jgi:POT family proton-dependent oligopeptide transporter
MTIDATARSAPAGARTFFGHPRGLFFLFSTELWERYAYYGMLAILVLYMQNHLFLSGHAEHVLLFAPIKRGLEWLYGPLSAQAMASHVYGIYVLLTYAAPTLGGIVADRFLGQRKAVLFGAALLSAGYFALSSEALFFVGFPLVFFGNGLFKPNISTQVGNMYAPGDLKRDSAFSIFYVGINIGGILGPLICGYLGEEVGWPFGFIAAGVGIAGGLVIYMRGLRALPLDALTKAKVNKVVKARFGREEWRAVGALIALAFLNIFFWGTWYLQFNIMNTWADVNTERHIALFDFTVPTTWFLTINGIFILSLTPFVTAFWAWQAKRGREPSTATKMAIGCILLGFSFLFMLLPVATLGPDGKTNLWWLVAFYAIYTAGELYVSPIGLALVTKVAPARIVSMMMGLWLASYAIGGLISGEIGAMWEKMSMSSFFILSAAIPIIAGFAIWAVSRPLRPILERAQPDDALTPGVV